VGTRRRFLIGSAAVVGGAAVFGYVAATRPLPNPLLDHLEAGEASLDRFVKITADNQVWIAVPRAEMGQGVQGSLAQLVAEELGLDWQDVHVFHPPGDAAYPNIEGLTDGVPFKPFDRGFVAESVRDVARVAGKFLGLQMTGGSSSVRDAWEPMRMSGALARELLLAEAAARFGVDTTDGLVIKDRQVFNGQRSFTFAELAPAAALRPIPSDINLTPKSNWKIIGQSVPRPDIPPKVDGTAEFGIDVELPDMLHAAVANAPAFGSILKLVDATTIQSMPGVVRVVELENAVAVVAQSYWQAKKALAALDITWTAAPAPVNSDTMFDDYQRLLDSAEEGYVFRNDGDAQTALAEGQGDVFEATYKVPYLAHTCMEPQSCTVLVEESGARVWMGAQIPTSIKTMVANTLGLDEKNVEVNVTLLGGGFGRRLEADIAIQTAQIAREFKGRPIKVVWSREEDTTHDFYRPAALGRLRAHIASDGSFDALDIRVVSQKIFSDFALRNIGFGLPDPDVTAGQGLSDQAYGFPNYRMEHRPVSNAIPVGNWRSVGHSFGAFFLESLLDEIAVAKNLDPVAMRMDLLKGHPVAQGVVEEVARLADWQGTEETKRGFAYHWCFASFSAQIVEIDVEGDALKVKKVWCAADAGPAVNPSTIRAQLESSIAYALSSALFQEITVKDGAVQQTNFHDFDAIRIFQNPDIEVSILENSPDIGGVGELGVPAVIPALMAAIARATGRRIRELPITKAGFVV